MRRLKWWESEEENRAGIRYTLSVIYSGGVARAAFVPAEGLKQESEYYEEVCGDEKEGIMNVMRGMFWKINDIPQLAGTLFRRMHCLAYADYDSECEGAVAPVSFGDLLAQTDKLSALVEEDYAEKEQEEIELIADLERIRNEIGSTMVLIDPFYVPAAGSQLDLFE